MDQRSTKPRCDRTDGHSCPYDSASHASAANDPPIDWAAKYGRLSGDVRAMRNVLRAREGEGNLACAVRAACLAYTSPEQRAGDLTVVPDAERDETASNDDV